MERVKVGNVDLGITTTVRVDDLAKAVYWFVLESIPESECCELTAWLTFRVNWWEPILEINIARKSVIEVCVSDGSIVIKTNTNFDFVSYLCNKFELSQDGALERAVAQVLKGLRDHRNWKR